MRTLSLFVLAFALFYGNGFAQRAKKITVTADDELMEAMSADMFRYPAFVRGKVVFRDGASVSAMLNYNLLVGEIQFINPKGDTLSLDNEKTIDYVTIDKDSFYYDHGYFEVIASNPAAKLAVRQKIKIMDKQKIGAFGQPSIAGSIDTYNSYTDNHTSRKLAVRENILLAIETDFYFGDKFNHFSVANKKNLLRLYAKHENKLEKYLKENNVNFNKAEDLQKVMEFLEGLYSSNL